MTYFMFSGLKRNQLTVMKAEGKDSRGKNLWRCKCLCGNETVLTTNSIMSTVKPTKSCGRCEWHVNHKEAYTSWMSMKQRCNYEFNKDYLSYGGRGINYDPKWESFVEFFIDMGDPPCDPITGERLSLDRRNNDGNYCKDNCRWATRSEQQLNKRTYTIRSKLAEQEEKL